ncbi:MAG: APC family permease [Scrofimicrobium sp.]
MPLTQSFATQSPGGAAATSGGGAATGTAKKMGLFAVILLGINGIIGSGAFLLPQEIYKDAGLLLGLASLFAAGTATLFIVFAYADLAGKVPGDGGAWRYCYTAWGRFPGFQVGIFVWFAGLATIATEIAALIRIFANLVPALKSHWLSFGIGAIVIVLLALINLFGSKLVQLIDNISSGVKIATAAFVVLLGAFAMKAANLKPLIPSDVKDAGESLSAVGTAYGVAFYLFAGFSFLTIAASKMKNSQKNLPKALLIVIISVTVVYLLIQLVTVGVLGSKVADSTVPVAEAMRHAAGEWAYYIVIAGTAVAVFGVAFACSFEVPILAASLANAHKLLPAPIGKLNKHGAPTTAIIITAALSIVMLSTGSYVFLASCVVVASAVQYVPTILAVIKLRNLPSAPGAFQLKGAMRWVVVALGLAATSYLFVSFTPKVLAVSGVVFIIGMVIYALDKRPMVSHEEIKPKALIDPVATRAGTAVIDRHWFPDFQVKRAEEAASSAKAPKLASASAGTPTDSKVSDKPSGNNPPQ